MCAAGPQMALVVLLMAGKARVVARFGRRRGVLAEGAVGLGRFCRCLCSPHGPRFRHGSSCMKACAGRPSRHGVCVRLRAIAASRLRHGRRCRPHRPAQYQIGRRLPWPCWPRAHSPCRPDTARPAPTTVLQSCSCCLPALRVMCRYVVAAPGRSGTRVVRIHSERIHWARFFNSAGSLVSMIL